MTNFFALVVLIISAPFAHAESAAKPQVCFKETCVEVEVVSTEKDMMRGLQGRTGLEKDKGMLFVFKADGIYPFWMKDMKFPIDILWLDHAENLIDISANVPACTVDPCPDYSPAGAIRYVLEVESGYAAAHGLKVADAAKIKDLPTL